MPAHRFRTKYEARRHSRRNPLVRVLSVVGGLALLVAGAVLMVIPGPGIPVALVGAGLLAREFRWAAVALDFVVDHASKAITWAKRQWSRASVPLRVVVVVLVAFAASAAGYGAYRVMF